MLEYQNIGIFSSKVTLQVGLKKCFWLKKLKALFRGHMLLMIWKMKKFKAFYKWIAKNKSKRIRIEKVIKRKGERLYVKWNSYDNSFNSWADKKEIV